jgi:hypothetical protein
LINLDENPTEVLEKMDPTSNKSHKILNQKETSTLLPMDSSPELLTAFGGRRNSDDDRSASFDRSPRDDIGNPMIIPLPTLDLSKLFDSFDDDNRPSSIKKPNQMSLIDSDDEVKRFTEPFAGKNTYPERKRSSPRDSPKASLKKDSKSKNAVKSAIFNRIDPEEPLQSDFITQRKKDQPSDIYYDKSYDKVPEIERITPDGKYFIANAKLTQAEVRKRYRKLFFVTKPPFPDPLGSHRR